jgi:hypothetical protein
MKQALEEHFKRKYLRWKQYKNSLPVICWDEDVPPFMYVGEVNSEGYVQWKAAEKDEVYDFKQIQDEFNFILNNDIKEYFNSYWFLELTGKYRDYSIILEPVIPGIGLRDFHFNLEEYFKSHRNQLNYIPIGFEANGLPIVMNNETGKVYIEDYENGSYKEIAYSIEELINQL